MTADNTQQDRHKYRLRYAKRGRMRFTSHRDFQRAIERAVKRAGVPMAYSEGFNPRPKISYANAAPTGAASEAEYIEFTTTAPVDCAQIAERLDQTLPVGLDVQEVIVAQPGNFAHRLEASEWRIRLDNDCHELQGAIDSLTSREQVLVSRVTKKGKREFDILPNVISITCFADDEGYAILRLVVRHEPPVVRPDDVLVGLRQVADFEPRAAVPTRVSQGPLTGDGIGDPFDPDRDPAKVNRTQET